MKQVERDTGQTGIITRRIANAEADDRSTMRKRPSPASIRDVNLTKKH